MQKETELYNNIYTEISEMVGLDATLKIYLRPDSMTRKWSRFLKDNNFPHIRLHDLRHSHVSLLINMGFDAVAIAERMGHESIDITFRYAHLFPTVQTEMADQLDELRKDDSYVC